MSLFRNLHALPPYTAEDHPTVAHEKIRAMFGAPVHAERNGPVATVHVPITEPGSPALEHESSITSAYLDKFVAIPMLHGDQPVASRTHG